MGHKINIIAYQYKQAMHCFHKSFFPNECKMLHLNLTRIKSNKRNITCNGEVCVTDYQK